MGWNFRKRIKLFGGFGLNIGKQGISPSLQTPFGSISPKGGSIRTGIPGLYYRFSNSPRNQAKQWILTEWKKVEQNAQEFLQRQGHLKRVNGQTLSTGTPLFNQVFSEVRTAVELGHKVQQDLVDLIQISSENRTGITSQLKNLVAELHPLLYELEELLTGCEQAMIEHEREQVAKRPPMTLPPPIPQEKYIRLDCWQCHQSIEVNATAGGQDFACPTCQAVNAVPIS